MSDNPVSWFILTVIVTCLIILFIQRAIKEKAKPAPKKIEYDQDLIFFD